VSESDFIRNKCARCKRVCACEWSVPNKQTLSLSFSLSILCLSHKPAFKERDRERARKKEPHTHAHTHAHTRRHTQTHADTHTHTHTKRQGDWPGGRQQRQHMAQKRYRLFYFIFVCSVSFFLLPGDWPGGRQQRQHMAQKKYFQIRLTNSPSIPNKTAPKKSAK